MLTKLVISCFLIALSLQTSDIGNTKSQELRGIVLESSEDIIRISADSYEYFVDESPRPYDVVVFFTAPDCYMCDEIEAELSKVAALYKKDGAIYPYKDESKRLRAVYFVKIVFNESSRGIFSRFGFRSVPSILTSQPRMLRLSGDDKRAYFKEHLWQISMNDGVLNCQKLLNYVNKKTGRDVEYKEPILHLLMVLATLACILSVGIAIFLRFREFFINPKLWFVGSMAVYFLCMSGIVYNTIHRVPPTGFGKDGETLWINPEARSQFGNEGYIMSGTISTIGILFLLLLRIPSFIEESNRRVAYLVVFALIYIVVRWLEDVYKQKSGFYSPFFWPPGHYQHGPLQNDQGNTI